LEHAELRSLYRACIFTWLHSREQRDSFNFNPSSAESAIYDTATNAGKRFAGKRNASAHVQHCQSGISFS
jgi:hypothetical protein